MKKRNGKNATENLFAALQGRSFTGHIAEKSRPAAKAGIIDLHYGTSELVP